MLGPDSQPSRFGLILLAAGSSSRLGFPKQLVQFHGRSLLRNAAETAVASGASPVVVVLGARADELRPELDGIDVTILVNEGWEEGMSSSIRCGVVVVSQFDVAGTILMLCDQPHVTADLLRALITEISIGGKVAVVCDHGEGVIGPPCIVSRPLFSAFHGLQGPQGARHVFRDLPAGQIAMVEFPLGAVDIDTASDVAALAS